MVYVTCTHSTVATPCGQASDALRCGSRRLACVSLQPLDHCVEADLTSAKPDALHHRAHEVGWDGERRLGRLPVHRGEENREERRDRRRLAWIEVGVEV